MKLDLLRSAMMGFALLVVSAVFFGCHYPKQYAMCLTAEDYLTFANEHPKSVLSGAAWLEWAQKTNQADVTLQNFLWEYVVAVDSAYGYRAFAEEYADYPGVAIASIRAQTLEEDSLLLILYRNPSIRGFEEYKANYPFSTHMRAINSCIDDLAFWSSGEPNVAFWNQYLQAYPNGLMADRASTGIYNLEIEELLAQAEPSEMVTSEPEFDDSLPESLSGLSIRNTCSSELTVFYQGTDETHKWVVAPNESVVVFISPDTYRIIASVEEDDVQNYEGRITFRGKDWKKSHYYIQRGRLGS